MLRVRVGKSILNLVTVYAPQVGRTMEEKEKFMVLLGKTVSAMDAVKQLVVCGDMNGHVGAKSEGFEGVHGGFGYGEQNVEGGNVDGNGWGIEPSDHQHMVPKGRGETGYI